MRPNVKVVFMMQYRVTFLQITPQEEFQSYQRGLFFIEVFFWGENKKYEKRQPWKMDFLLPYNLTDMLSSTTRVGLGRYKGSQTPLNSKLFHYIRVAMVA